MRFLLEPGEVQDAQELISAGRAALAAGLDGVFLRATPELPAPLVAAAALGGALEHLLVAVDVTLGDRSPIELAEEAAVVDLGLAGRLVLGVHPDPEESEGFEEALDLLRTAFAPRPFRWEGRRWRVPANLAENVNNPERRLRVSPSPYQPRMEIWGCGPLAWSVLERGLGHVSGADDSLEGLARRWSEVAGRPFAVGAPRVRRHRFESAAALRAELLSGSETFGQDWAIVGGKGDVAAVVGREVRPHVQLDSLPTGVAGFWEKAP